MCVIYIFRMQNGQSTNWTDWSVGQINVATNSLSYMLKFKTLQTINLTASYDVFSKLHPKLYSKLKYTGLRNLLDGMILNAEISVTFSKTKILQIPKSSCLLSSFQSPLHLDLHVVINSRRKMQLKIL